MAMCCRRGRTKKKHNRKRDDEVMKRSNGGGLDELEGGWRANPWSISFSTQPGNLCSERQKERETKGSGKRGDQRTLHSFPVEMQREGEGVKGLSVSRRKRKNLLSHPSIQTLKPRRCSSCEATYRERAAGRSHKSPRKWQEKAGEVRKMLHAERRKRRGCRMSSVRNQRINCEECNKRENKLVE